MMQILQPPNWPRPRGYSNGIATEGGKLDTRTRLGRRDGQPLWVVTVPAHGRATLRYRVPA